MIVRSPRRPESWQCGITTWKCVAAAVRGLCGRSQDGRASEDASSRAHPRGSLVASYGVLAQSIRMKFSIARMMPGTSMVIAHGNA